MPDRVRVIGSYLSPYVRKVLVCKMIRTPPVEHRAVLAEMGAPLTSETVGTTTPRPGPMSV